VLKFPITARRSFSAQLPHRPHPLVVVVVVVVAVLKGDLILEQPSSKGIGCE